MSSTTPPTKVERSLSFSSRTLEVGSDMKILPWVGSRKLKARLEAALFKVSSAMAMGRAAAEFGSGWR